MKKLLVLAVVFAAVWTWQKGRLPFTSPPGAFGADGKPVVWVFTFPDCGAPCQNALAELKRRDVPFAEKSVSPSEPDSANYRLWESLGKINNFPLTVAGNERAITDSPSELAGLLANSFGERYLNAGEKRYFKAHFHADGSPRIVLYGTSWCGICAKLRKELADASEDYLDIDVEKEPYGEDMMRTLFIGGYPAVWVGYTRVRGSSLRDVMAVKS